MATLERRLTAVEGAVDEHSRTLVGTREALSALEQRMDARFEAVDRRFEAVDRRFEAIDRRFDAVDRRFDGLERRMDTLDDKISRHFAWVVGIQVTTLVAIVAALLAR